MRGFASWRPRRGRSSPSPVPPAFGALATRRRRALSARRRGAELPRRDRGRPRLCGPFTGAAAAVRAGPRRRRRRRAARRARRGSDFVSRTRLGLYVAGVLEAEDATLTGAAREALGRVVAHNARQTRHAARPLCDTTHCQAFLGTPARRRREQKRAATRLVDDRSERGLARFLAGRRRAVERDATAPEGRGARARRSRWASRAGACAGPRRRRAAAPPPTRPARRRARSCAGRSGCRPVRGAARREGDRFVFDGRGRGHGEGLDFERARASPLDADALLQQAYGKR